MVVCGFKKSILSNSDVSIIQNTITTTIEYNERRRSMTLTLSFEKCVYNKTVLSMNKINLLTTSIEI